ncbi:MAG: endonuclease/exonuclease/phosphatase family protein [Solirubrobacterales bacterium]
MPIKIASYNIENMFRRPKAFFDPRTQKANNEILEAYSLLTQLLEQDSYRGSEEKIVELLGKLTPKRDDEDKVEFAVLREIRGRLLDGPSKVVAKGRSDWIGWVELTKEAVDSTATENTAAIIADVDPDVLAVVEAEDRLALERFNEYVLWKVTKGEKDPWRFGHAMLIDGNDERGIDVGVMTKDGFPIGRALSHVDDERGGSTIFSRDCPEFEIPTLGGGTLLLMVNHFKSKIGGGGEKRRQQAQRVAEIYAERRREGWDSIVIAGDLNDTPGSKPLLPLLANTDLKDAGDHEDFEWGDGAGTHWTGDRIDYLLLSPFLFEAFRAGGVNRRGIWEKANLGNDEKMLPTLTELKQSASDHAAIWVELDV